MTYQPRQSVHTIVANAKTKKAAEVVASLAKEAGVLSRSDYRVTKQLVLVGHAEALVETLLASRRSLCISDSGLADALSILVVDMIEGSPTDPPAARGVENVSLPEEPF